MDMAFSISNGFWLHTQNFKRSQTSGRKCTYFHIQGINKDGMNYTSYYTFMDGSIGNMPYFGKFYKTPAVAREEREKNNALNVEETRETWHPRDFRVIYSDYSSCIILRVFKFHHGYACMVLVKEELVTTTMPLNCSLVYHNACNKPGISELIYENTCDKSALIK
ncbi:hypothetical protein V5799_030752 [Amblyomma americanum]|uniref:Uncharacterized protein n=1 Tax=Amblyomma americanum TaxID=6943 RepID=A0AAQ4EN74_AMBAM